MSGRVLIALDLGAASEQLTHSGLSLARALEAEPILLYAYDFPPPSPSSFYPEASRAIHEQAMLDLRRLARECDPTIEDRQLLARSGSAARVIVETARELGAQLIVVGTHRLRGIERLLVGSTAESVARRAPCPVLVVPCTLPVGRQAIASAAAQDLRNGSTPRQSQNGSACS